MLVNRSRSGSHFEFCYVYYQVKEGACEEADYRALAPLIERAHIPRLHHYLVFYDRFCLWSGTWRNTGDAQGVTDCLQVWRASPLLSILLVFASRVMLWQQQSRETVMRKLWKSTTVVLHLIRVNVIFLICFVTVRLAKQSGGGSFHCQPQPERSSDAADLAWFFLKAND